MKRLFGFVALLIAVGVILHTPSREPSTFEIARAQQRLNDGVWRAVVIGDSVAHGAGDESGRGLAGSLAGELRDKSDQSLVPVNLGLDGARTANVERLLRQQAARNQLAAADSIVVSLGGNDLYGDSLARLLSRFVPWYQRERTSMRLARLVDEIQRINPAAQLFVLGLYNPYPRSSLAAWLNTQVNLWDGGLIQRLADRRKVTVIRIADLLAREDRISPIDHFHPGSRGYRAIARRISETL